MEKAAEGRVVHPVEEEQMGARVHDGDGHGPAVRGGFRLGGVSRHFLRYRSIDRDGPYFNVCDMTPPSEFYFAAGTGGIWFSMAEPAILTTSSLLPALRPTTLKRYLPLLQKTLESSHVPAAGGLDEVAFYSLGRPGGRAPPPPWGRSSG